MTYDAAADLFADAGEAATLALPNKIIYLERDHAGQKIIALAAERGGLDLNDLLVLDLQDLQPPRRTTPSITCGPTISSTCSEDDPGGRRARPAE